MRAITLTLQPAIDRILRIDKLRSGQTFDAQPLLVVPAGKGVNTARALKCLESPKSKVQSPKFKVAAAVWIGAEDAAWYARRLRALSGIEALCCPRPCATRHAITLLDRRGVETHVKELMPAPSAAEQDALLRFWARTVRRGDVAAVCGSAPAGTSHKTLRRIFQIARERGAAQIIADTSGPLLEVAGAAGLAGIKGNAAEIAAWLRLPKPFDPWLLQHRAALAAAFKRKRAPKTIIITRSKRGAVAANKGAMAVAVLRGMGVSPMTHGQDARATVVAATGCGDAATAGWLWALRDGCALEETLRRVVACGTAKLASADPGCIDADRVNELLKQIEIHSSEPRA